MPSPRGLGRCLHLAVPGLWPHGGRVLEGWVFYTLGGFGEQNEEVLFVRSFPTGIDNSLQTPYTASGLKTPSVAGGK